MLLHQCSNESDSHLHGIPHTSSQLHKEENQSLLLVKEEVKKNARKKKIFFVLK